MNDANILAQAMMGQGMAQDPRMGQQPQPPPGLWERLMALFQGQQQPEQAAPGYLPPDALPPDAQEIQRRKAEALLNAMRGQM